MTAPLTSVTLLAALFFATHRVASCPATCFDYTCDHWVADGKGCADIEAWGCDCGGCDCDPAASDNGAAADDKTADDDKGAWDDKDGTWAEDDAAAGSWTTETLGGRSYEVYVPAMPAGGYAGVVLYFHGVGGSSAVKYSYGVGVAADRGGFVGVIPNGSPTGVDGAYAWIIDDPAGVDEVAFVHALVAEVLAAYEFADESTIFAQGFSNGAGMAELLGCHSSYNLYVAYLAVRYDPAATAFGASPACASEASPCAEWNAVGANDYFLDTIGGASGILAQFEDLRVALECPDVPASAEAGDDGETCYSYAGCEALGELCVYDGLGHDIVGPGMANRAWDYLSARSCGSSTRAPAAFLFDTDGAAPRAWRRTAVAIALLTMLRRE